MSGPRAAIDVGSNSLLLTVVDGDGHTLHDQVTVVGLGRGLGDMGHMEPARRVHGARVLADYVNTAATFGVPAAQIRACATSGARRAVDAPELFAELERALGLQVRTISGDEEARLTYLGALDGLPLPPGEHLVIDLGGGSTEVVLGRGPELLWRHSLEVGAVRLTEAHIGLGEVRPQGIGALRAHIHAAMQALPQDFLSGARRPSAVVAVAGTATTLAAIQLGLKEYDASKVHGHPQPVSALRGLAQRLREASPAQRREIAAISPERADFLMAGAELLIALCRPTGLPALLTSNGGLRYGILADAAASLQA